MIEKAARPSGFFFDGFRIFLPKRLLGLVWVLLFIQIGVPVTLFKRVILYRSGSP